MNSFNSRYNSRFIQAGYTLAKHESPDESQPAQALADNSSGLSYRDAGVNIDAGNELVRRISGHVKRTTRPEVLGGLGGFGGLFQIPLERYKNPVLVAATDGVGTKLKLAIESGIHHTIGIDLVAMSVNDLIVQGAEPLFFLDYYATGALHVDVAEQVIKGISEGCLQAGAALIGGETAEMPGMYQSGDYDLAGFCVGIVERDQIIDGSKATVGDKIIGLASSGPHSNGYSLVRKVISANNFALDSAFPDDSRSLGEVLLEPTRIYVKAILQLLDKVPVSAIAHITGGGLPENIPRVLPDNLAAHIDSLKWPTPAVFDWLQKHGNIKQTEMLRTFNCGIGMVVCVPEDMAQTALEILAQAGETAYLIGELKTRESDQSVIIS